MGLLGRASQKEIVRDGYWKLAEVKRTIESNQRMIPISGNDAAPVNKLVPLALLCFREAS